MVNFHPANDKQTLFTESLVAMWSKVTFFNQYAFEYSQTNNEVYLSVNNNLSRDCCGMKWVNINCNIIRKLENIFIIMLLTIRFSSVSK